jgi:hypothetical protein
MLNSIEHNNFSLYVLKDPVKGKYVKFQTRTLLRQWAALQSFQSDSI